jgi:hypothetical protein
MEHVLAVEWSHPLSVKNPPYRNADTGEEFLDFIKRLEPVLAGEGIGLRVKDRAAGEQGAGAGELFLNGRLLDSLLSEVATSQFICAGRRCDSGPEEYFRTVYRNGAPVVEVPEILIRKAVLLALEETGPARAEKTPQK